MDDTPKDSFDDPIVKRRREKLIHGRESIPKSEPINIVLADMKTKQEERLKWTMDIAAYHLELHQIALKQIKTITEVIRQIDLISKESLQEDLEERKKISQQLAAAWENENDQGDP